MREYLELVVAFFKVGILTFGGGYAMLPMLQREIIEKRKWATEDEILNYYAIGQCTPGIIAVNTATFIGNKQKGVLGGFLATLGIILPSLIIITLIASLLQNFSDIVAVQHALAGVRVAVVVLVAYSVVKLMKSAVKDGIGWLIFLLTFAVAVIFDLSPVLIVVVAGAAGVLAKHFTERKAG